MKKCFLPCIAFFMAIQVSFAQNNPPVLSNIAARADTILHRLTVTYDVSDAENDAVEVFLNVSTDGIYFEQNTSNATGDVGFPITPGTTKHLFWDYPDSLSGMLPSLVVKLAADDHQTAITIQQILAQIDSNRLKQNMQMVVGIRHRITGATHLQEVRDSLLARFQHYGLETRTHEFSYNSYTGKNIVGRKPSVLNDTKTFIVSGHYDTVDDSPGADDNGSAQSAILEILRVLAPLDLTSTVEFISFDLEESGLRGSQAFVPTGIQPYEKIAGVINMDMIGYYSEQPNSQTFPQGFDIAFPDLYARLEADSFRGNFIISTANTNSKSLQELYDTMAAQYVPDLLVGPITVPGNGEIINDARRSDHAAFWDAGYKALHLSDGAETRNPNYHGPNDTLGSLNFTFMYQNTLAIAATLLSLAAPMHADIETVQVTGDPFSSVWQIDDEGCQIYLSPNPANGYLKISTHKCGEGKMYVKLISMEGKTIREEQLAGLQEFQFGKEIKPGYYFVEVTNSKQVYTRKILIQ